MYSIVRKISLLAVLASVMIGFSLSANATYYTYSNYGYSSSSYGSYSNYNNYSSYNNYSYSSSYYGGSSYGGYYGGGCHYGSYYGSYYYDKKPKCHSDTYHIEVGDSLHKNVLDNDTKGDGRLKAYISSGSLPTGFSLSRRGSLIGTATKAGHYTVRYTIYDEDWDASSCYVTIKITEPNLTPTAVDDVYTYDLGAAIDQNVIDENDTQGDGVATAMLVSGELPPGVTLAADGSLSGIATQAGVFQAKYKIADEDGDTSEAYITITVTEPISYCPQAADLDDLGGGSGGHAVDIWAVARDLRFIGTPTATRTLPDGDLQIDGTVAQGELVFDVSLTYSDYMATSDNPKLELPSSAYVSNGGPIDPSTWEFYAGFAGTLTGTGGDWDGVVLSLTLRGPKAQIGIGASGKNGNFGLANWFDAEIVSAANGLPDGFYIGQSLVGDVNADLPDECPRQSVEKLCALEAQGDAFSNYGGGHAVIVFDINGGSFIFDPAGEAEFFDNGDLIISGSATDGNSVVDVSLEYTGSTTDFMSTKLELIDSAYVDMGGPVDPSTWSYFTALEGTITGLSGELAGVVLDAEIRGSLPQIGDGANGKNITFGMSNWFDFTVLEAPNSADVHVGQMLVGDLNIDINDSCLVQDLPVAAVNDSFENVVGGGGVSGNILDNDTLGDPETTITFDPADIPAGFTLLPNGEFSGDSEVPITFSFPYKITDADGDMATAVVTVVITNIIIGPPGGEG